MNNDCYILQCPIDYIICVFDFIDTVELITTVKLVCKIFYNTLWSERVLNGFYKRHKDIDRNVVKSNELIHKHILYYKSFFIIDYSQFLLGRVSCKISFISDSLGQTNNSYARYLEVGGTHDIVHNILLKIINGTGTSLLIHMKRRSGKTMIILLIQVIFCLHKRGAILLSISNSHRTLQEKRNYLMNIVNMLNITQFVAHHNENYIDFNNGSRIDFKTVGEIEKIQNGGWFGCFYKIFIDELFYMTNSITSINFIVPMKLFEDKIIWISTFLHVSNWNTTYAGEEYFKWRYGIPLEENITT